jgi:hypothetical protein
MREVRSLRLPHGDHVFAVVATTKTLEPSSAPPAADLWAAAKPNPFESETALHYNVPAAGTVTLQIFDVNGRLVWRGVPRAVEAGQYVEIWQGRWRNGQPAAAGVYLLRATLVPEGGLSSRHPETTTSKFVILR